MKQLKDYLNEGLLSRKVSTKTPIRYKPETKEELKNIIIDLLKKGQTNLNCIDVSNIKDMSWLFNEVSDDIKVKEIDISEWNVSNVNDMHNMFFCCIKFNSDLSEWDVSKVKDMSCMFWDCKNLNVNISKWDVSNVEDMDYMFSGCDTLKKNNKIPAWYNGKL